MTIDIKQKLEELKKLNAFKDKLNNKIKIQLTNKQNISEALTNFHKPVIEKIEESTELSLRESKPLEIPKSKYISQAAIEENITKFEPYQILNKNINPRLQAKSLVPKFQNKIIKGITFESIIINDKEFIIFQAENIPFIFLYETSKEKYQQNRYSLTEGLENLIKGYIQNESKLDLENYIKILNSVRASTNSKHYKEVIQRIKKYNYPIVQEGEGIGESAASQIIYLPSNPIDLFIELRKLLAAHTAGNTNNKNTIHAILKSLLEKNSISTEKYQKILKKYHL